MATLPKLKNPPIDEVVCGFIFEPTPFTMLDFGVYAEKKMDYPRREFRPAISERPVLQFGGVPRQRCWLISEDETLVLQLQHDRFFLNWRKRSGEYPRFSDHPDSPGLLTLALAEFEKFRNWAKSREVNLKLIRLELTKIDVLRKGVEFQDFLELSNRLKLAKVFSNMGLSTPVS